MESQAGGRALRARNPSRPAVGRAATQPRRRRRCDSRSGTGFQPPPGSAQTSVTVNDVAGRPARAHAPRGTERRRAVHGYGSLLGAKPVRPGPGGAGLPAPLALGARAPRDFELGPAAHTAVPETRHAPRASPAPRRARPSRYIPRPGAVGLRVPACSARCCPTSPRLGTANPGMQCGLRGVAVPVSHVPWALVGVQAGAAALGARGGPDRELGVCPQPCRGRAWRPRLGPPRHGRRAARGQQGARPLLRRHSCRVRCAGM